MVNYYILASGGGGGGSGGGVGMHSSSIEFCSGGSGGGVVFNLSTIMSEKHPIMMVIRGGKIGPAWWASPIRPKLGPGWAIKFFAPKKPGQIWPGPVWPSPVWPGPARPARIFFALK